MKLFLIVLLIIGLISLEIGIYHHDKAECIAHHGVWKETMSTGSQGYSWSCTYDPHIQVTF